MLTPAFFYSGESYMDVTLRLETIILDIERTREPILIVGKLFHCQVPPTRIYVVSHH